VEIDPRPADAAQRIADEILSSPPVVVDELKRILGSS
jgi:hypothetical protein